MDGSEDSSYLTLLNDGTNNYLLQAPEEALTVQDSIEPMFTEIEDATASWSVGLPILMNGNLISEDQPLEPPMDLPPQIGSEETTMNLPSSLPELCDSSIQNETATSNADSIAENGVTYPIEIPGKGFITADGVFIANDLLLQLKLANTPGLSQDAMEPPKLDPLPSAEQDILINPKTLVPYVSESLDPPLVQESSGPDLQPSLLDVCENGLEDFDSNNVIHLYNTHGIANIPKEQLLNCSAKNEAAAKEDMFEVIMAHKCKRCAFICEHQHEIVLHWTKEHAPRPQLKIEDCEEKILKYAEERVKEPEVKQFNGLGEVKVMKSILKNNDHQTVFLCSECNLGFGSTEKLKSHMIAVHKLVQKPDDNTMTPQVETKKPKAKSKLSLSLIQKQAKASRKIKCSVKGCDLRFAMDEMRARHEMCHVQGQKKQFRCFECSTKFSIWRVCSMHMWKCHKIDLGLFTCQMCHTFKAHTAVRLLSHMAIHREEKPFLCNECGKAFKQQTQLRNHQIFHKKNTDEVPEWMAPCQCEICKKYFSSAKSLKKHIQSVHDQFKPFICNICGHKAARKAMLELHLRQHTGEKPHKCPLCEYKTGDHNSLRRHMMRHSGATKYACPHCSYSSIQSTSYKNHIASKHPGLGGSFFCTVCSYHTVNETTYLNHVASHKKDLLKNCCDIDGIRQEFITADNAHNGNIEDAEDESQSYLLLMDHSNDAIDTGGITIPAGLELQVPL